LITFGNKTHGWAELVAWQPRALLLHGFLAHEECDHIIQVAGSRVWA
jgi:prolyl 4-hydroxylase